MPPMLSKTLLALVLLIGAIPCFYLLGVIAFEELVWPGYRWAWAFLTINVVAAAGLAFCWVILWHREVRWTRDRRIRTAVAAGGALLPAGLLFLVVAALANEEFAMVLAGICWATVWLGSTAIIWRETPVERADRTPGGAGYKVLCLQCGYDMTGLHEARCPECGRQYTLDGLLAASVKPDPLGHQG